MTLALIAVGLVTLWFVSAWVVLRIGVGKNHISADVMDGALLFGPLGFGVVLWFKYETKINNVIRRVRQWLRKPRRLVIRYWPTRTIVIELSRWELAVTHFAKPRTP